MSASPPTFLVARRDTASADAVVSLLRDQNFAVLPPVFDGMDALSAIALHHPTVALLGCDLPGPDLLDLLERLLDSPVPTRVVVNTRNPYSAAALDAFRLGAFGYLPCEAEPDEFLRCVRTVLRGDLYLSPTLSVGLVDLTLLALEPEANSYRVLSRREQEIFMLIGEGLSSREIAERLQPQVSEDTVETHRRNIREKLGIKGSGSAMLKEAILYMNRKRRE